MLELGVRVGITIRVRVSATQNWKNLATSLRIILRKSLKRTCYDIEKQRITKFFRVIFFHFKALSCIP